MKVCFFVLFLIVRMLCENSITCYAKECVERFSEIYSTPEEIPPPDREYSSPDGIYYCLSNSELEEIVVPQRVEVTEGEVVYRGIGRETPVPGEAEIQVWDEAGAQELPAILPLLKTEYVKERWQAFRFALTFHEYDADTYIMNETAIDAEDALIQLAQRENEVLEMLGLFREQCRGFFYEWAGEPYNDREGVLCRDVIAQGERRVWDCHAKYGGEVTVPSYTRYRMKYSYITVEEERTSVSSSDNRIESPQNSGVGEEKESIKGWLMKTLRTCLEVTVGFLLLVLFILGFRFLLSLFRKVQKEKEKRDI